MKTLGSLSDLSSLLGTAPKEEKIIPKTGYDGKAQHLKVKTDSKRRAGKIVTLVSGFQSTPQELDRIAGKLKKICGAGGRVLDNEIEIQGNHADKVIKFLSDEGYAAQ